MKRPFLTITFLLIITICFAQIEKPILKGNKIIGGTISASYSTTKYNKEYINRTFSYYINPSFGYFIIDKVTIGASTQFYGNKHKLFDNEIINTDFIGAGPFIKYYDKRGIFTSLNLSYLTNLNNSGYHFFSINPNVGYAFFLNKNSSLELGLNYNFKRNYYNPDIYFDNNENKFFISIGFINFL